LCPQFISLKKEISNQEGVGGLNPEPVRFFLLNKKSLKKYQPDLSGSTPTKKIVCLQCSEQTKKYLGFFQPNGFAFFHLLRSASSGVEIKEISLLILVL